MILPSFFSAGILQSFKESLPYLNGLLIVVAVQSIKPLEKNVLIKTLLTAGLIISILAVYQYFFGFRHLLNYLSERNETSAFIMDYIQSRRVFFPFITPNILAGYLIMLLPLSLINKKTSWISIPLGFALLLTKSIGALLGLLTAMVVYFRLIKTPKKKFILMLSGLIMAVCIVLAFRSLKVNRHLEPSFSTKMRIAYWKNTLKIIKAHPLTGTGLGKFDLKQSSYAHNSYLQIWAEMGPLAVISFLWLIIAGIKKMSRKIKHLPDKKFNTGLLSANIAFLTHNFFDFSFFLPEIGLIWWLIYGLGINDS